MNTPTHHDISSPDTIIDPSGPDRSVHRAHTELTALQQRLHELYATRPTRDADWADRSARLALIYARRAGWWHVLSVAAYRTGLHPVYRYALIIARHGERDRARFWRDTAQEWTARAEQRPTSDAAGALSNWHELGVTA